MSNLFEKASCGLRATFALLGRLLRENVRVVLVALAAVVVLWILSELAEGELLKIDAAAYELFVVKLRSDALTPVVESITGLAAPITVVVMWVVASAFAPGRKPGMAMAANLVGAVAINQILKFIVQRPRPDGFNLIVETGYSFPSGHSMVAMAFYGFLAYLVWHYEKDALMRWVWCCALGLVIVGIGASRIYLGVHYASDVIAGFLISLAWLAVFTKVFCPLFLPERGRAEEERAGENAGEGCACGQVAEGAKGIRGADGQVAEAAEGIGGADGQVAEGAAGPMGSDGAQNHKSGV